MLSTYKLSLIPGHRRSFQDDTLGFEDSRVQGFE
jgi:hypothetical protein